jgi:hypothetical protein
MFAGLKGEAHPRRGRAGVVETVHGSAPDVDEVAGAARDNLFAEQELDLALNDVERLVLVAVDVRRRAAAGRHNASIAKYAPPDSSPVTRNR